MPYSISAVARITATTETAHQRVAVADSVRGNCATPEVIGEQALWIQPVLEVQELLHPLVAVGATDLIGGEDGVFGEVEAAAGGEDAFGHFVRQLPEAIARGVGDAEVERQRPAVERVRQQEVVGPMALQHAEIRTDAGALATFEHIAQAGARGSVRHEHLILDEPALA